MFTFPEGPGPATYIDLYGDEASIRIGKGLIFLYAFCRFPDDRVPVVAEAMNNLKRWIRPNADPASWAFHMVDVRSPEWRNKHRVPHRLGEINQKVERFIRSLDDGAQRHVYAVTVLPALLEENTTVEKVRDYTLAGALYWMTNWLTSQGITPRRFVIEAQMQGALRANQLDEFVERIGRSLRRQLAYLYIARQRDVGLPVTAAKGSCVELEVADCLAFWSRRHLHMNHLGRPAEIDLASFGLIHWGVFGDRGLTTHAQPGFPHEHLEEPLVLRDRPPPKDIVGDPR